MPIVTLLGHTSADAHRSPADLGSAHPLRPGRLGRARVRAGVCLLHLRRAGGARSDRLAQGLEATPISLAPSALVGYAARTALRMLIAMLASLLFTFTYATLAAKSRRAEVVLVPLLDILQSVPILSFSITIVFFL